ncbi:hypothetical protein BBJ28_00002584 [Nothophytophthora sp. Chile5]|nr:hypothetical protein BBJ28_00002584 [Nothophytophthora sp. Chile5]
MSAEEQPTESDFLETMSKSDSQNGAAGAAASTKKKSASKSRKRKTSDAGAVSKTNASPAKRVATEATAGGGVSGAGADLHGAAASLVKPFVKGELVESTGISIPTVRAWLFSVTFQTKKAMEMATIKGKLDTDCFIFLIRKDPERYDRIAELLRANDEFRAVLNSGFDPSDEKMY